MAAEDQQEIPSHRGIPAAPFIQDVAAYIGTDKPEVILGQLQELLAKYRFMEASTSQRKQNMLEKIPEFKETIEIVQLLKTQQDQDSVDTHFELTDTLYAKAKLQSESEVYLWLGANVMLAYPHDEAIDMLTSKLRVSKKTLDHAIDDLDFLREQITVVEVGIARVHNWNVKQRRLLKADAGPDADDD